MAGEFVFVFREGERVFTHPTPVKAGNDFLIDKKKKKRQKREKKRVDGHNHLRST